MNSSKVLKDGSNTWYISKNWILLDAPQVSEPWLKYRQGRGTGSVMGTILGHGNQSFGTPDSELKYLSGQETKVFSEKSLIAMKQGNLREPLARDWYMDKFKLISVELGILFPTWETRIGASIDGLVIDPKRLMKQVDEYNPGELVELADGILEIKSPMRMYYPLIRYLNTTMPIPNTEERSDLMVYERFYSHIWHKHFDQMQQGMAVTRKPWCDYLVYAEQGIFIQRVHYCHNYFVKRMLEPARKYFDERLDPILGDYRVPLPSMQE
jgi:YqaJ-like recombinase protein